MQECVKNTNKNMCTSFNFFVFLFLLGSREGNTHRNERQTQTDGQKWGGIRAEE